MYSISERNVNEVKEMIGAEKARKVEELAIALYTKVYP